MVSVTSEEWHLVWNGLNNKLLSLSLAIVITRHFVSMQSLLKGWLSQSWGLIFWCNKLFSWQNPTWWQ